MASAAFATLASRSSRFLFCARVFTPSVALEDMCESCRARVVVCVEASEKSVTKEKELQF